MATEAPLIVILGPTASGKTAVSIELAKRISGEIICADSRTVYRGMDIGTAKPTKDEMDGVPHHMIDLVNPDQRFTLWNFQQIANKKIKEIRNRNSIPIMVGGSGLYIDSILFDYKLGQGYELDADLGKYDKKSINDLQTMLKKLHIELPSNALNRRHLVGALERGSVNKSRLDTPIENAIIVGITTEKNIIQQRIIERSINMLNSGLIEEVEKLVNIYGKNCEPIRKNSYGVIEEYLDNKKNNREELIQKMLIVDRRLVKKQLTWWRRNRFISWMNVDEVVPYIIDKIS